MGCSLVTQRMLIVMPPLLKFPKLPWPQNSHTILALLIWETGIIKSLTSPWEYWKSIEVTSSQKWRVNEFSHNSKGTWNGKVLATSAHYTYSMVGGKRSIVAKGKMMAPFVSAVAAEFHHQDDGITYTPKFSL